MKQTLNILHVGKFYPPEHGGIESVTAALAETHAAQGHNVRVVCFTTAKQQDVSEGHLQITRCKARFRLASQPLGLRYLLAVLKHSRSADIIHLHAPNLVASFAALFLPGKAKLLVHWHADILGKGKMGTLVAPLERAMLRRADMVVCTTETYAKASRPLAPYHDKIRVIPIGIPDLAKTAPVHPPRVDPLEWAQGRPVILTVGRLVPYKGLSTLLKAAARMQTEAAFAIVGTGPLQKALSEEIEDLGLQDRVRLLGRLETKALERLFASSTLFCLTSIDRAEAFGVVLLEAMRAGLPVVATTIPASGVSWVNAHGFSGENVPPKDAGALAETLARILSDPQLTETYGRQARRRFESEFTQAKMARAFLEAYQDLLD